MNEHEHICVLLISHQCNQSCVCACGKIRDESEDFWPNVASKDSKIVVKEEGEGEEPR